MAFLVTPPLYCSSHLSGAEPFGRSTNGVTSWWFCTLFGISNANEKSLAICTGAYMHCIAFERLECGDVRGGGDWW
jgi:hypothetical protein